jgi:hypothetical protein
MLGDSKNPLEGLATESSVLREGFATKSAILQEFSSTTLAWQIQLPMLLQDSKNL